MEVKVLFFGQAADKVQKNELVVSAIKSSDELNIYLKGICPSLKDFQYRLAVNHIIISENIKLKDGDIIALLPPFSGG